MLSLALVKDQRPTAKRLYTPQHDYVGLPDFRSSFTEIDIFIYKGTNTLQSLFKTIAIIALAAPGSVERQMKVQQPNATMENTQRQRSLQPDRNASKADRKTSG